MALTVRDRKEGDGVQYIVKGMQMGLTAGGWLLAFLGCAIIAVCICSLIAWCIYKAFGE